MLVPLMSSPDFPTDLNALRKQLKRRRAVIPPQQRQQAAKRAWQHLRHWPPLRRAKKIACYLAMPDEFPTDAIIAGLLRQGKAVYVPIIDRYQQRKMVFQRFAPAVPKQRNRFGIVEPILESRHQVPTAQLDLVLMPLVGFDQCGVRLGMGGGYYDTNFAFRMDRWRLRKPLLLGLAFNVQHCEHLKRNEWDVPVDAMLTETGVRRVTLPK